MGYLDLVVCEVEHLHVLVALQRGDPGEAVVFEMQFAQVGQDLQVVDALDEVVAEVEAAQFLVVLEGTDGPDALVGQLDLENAGVVLLASRLYDRLPLHF